MKCQKCTKPAVVHLTELVPDPDGVKHPVEIHLCMAHAVEAGFLAAGAEAAQKQGNVEPAIIQAPAIKPLPADAGLDAPKEEPTALVPNPPAPPSGLSVVRKEPAAIRPADTQACPVCGMTWQQFKQGGLMGCANDYTFFAARLAGLIKRAQENFIQHAGKVPTKMRQSVPGKSVTVARLRRELAQAVECEHYEEAAKLRDQLKAMGE